MNADVLLVNLPPYESYYADGVPHLGMLYVLTSLKAHGYTASYLDCAHRITRRDEVLRAIEESQPRMVGFSIDTDNLLSAGRMSRAIKEELSPEIKIIFGGPASQGQAEEIMQNSAADVLVIGEGEYTAREVADCLLRGQGTLAQIPGICYRTEEGLVFTEARAPIDELDDILIPDHDFLPEGVRYAVNLISGRGCPFKCTFCFEGRMGNVYRHRSPENILTEIEYLVERYGRPFIAINDDTFTSDVAHTLEVCRLIKERFTPWEDLLLFCEVRADVVNKHPELVDALISAGVARVQIGVESADVSVLKAYKRLNVKPDVVESVISRFHAAGLPSLYCGFILGGPSETLASMQKTLDFAKRMVLEVAPGMFECNVSFLTPLPGTEIRSSPELYGVRLLDPDLVTSSNFNYCVAETQDLSREQINNFRRRFSMELDDAIIELIPKLPRHVLAAHARLSSDFDVATAYFNKFGRFPRMMEYFNLVGGAKGLPAASEFADDELLERFPTRLSHPISLEQDCVVIDSTPKHLKLNRIGSQIYGFCSGKLTGHEIAKQIASSQDSGGPGFDRIRADVVGFLRHLDGNYAVFHKDY